MTVWLNDRAVLAVSGPEARTFLQGLVTCDMGRLAPGSPRYGALLTPQGKVLFDFLAFEQDGVILLDCPVSQRDALAKRLMLYRLRARVEIGRPDDLVVVWQPQGQTGAPFVEDPRLAALGNRAIIVRPAAPLAEGMNDYAAVRVRLGVPEGLDFGQDRMFALDADLDELGAVAFDKGCYVGQEMSARMKHRGTARKRLLPVVVPDARNLPAEGTAITVSGREVATLQSSAGNRGFALARLDRLEEAGASTVLAGSVPVVILRPEWLFS